MTVFKIIEMLERIESKVDAEDRWLGTQEACTYASVSEKNLAEKCGEKDSEMFNRRRKKSVPKKRFEKMASAEVVAGDVG